MPKSKTEMMKRLRQSRKDAGLVEYRLWCTPKELDRVLKLVSTFDKLPKDDWRFPIKL